MFALFSRFASFSREVCLGCLLLGASACGRVFEYPELETEASLELCSDGEDNDFDGATDCADPDCDGFCSEETAQECSDGRDNDGDGFTDDADPRCWLIDAPNALRCAELHGVELFETFDGDSIGFADPASPWQFINRSSYPKLATHQDASRQDSMVVLPRVYSGTNVDRSPGVLFWSRPFSGSWRGFDLGFAASAPTGSVLSVAVMPMEFAPSERPPSEGAENRLLSVKVDAAREPPVFALTVDDLEVSAELPFTQSFCGSALCSEYFGQVRVTSDGSGFVATLDYPDLPTVELYAPPSGQPYVPPSRLVMLGGALRFEGRVTLDDLHLSVKPEWPCGFADAVPAESACAVSDGFSAFGHTVSVAKGPGEQYCALLGASHAPSEGPEALTTWLSSDGKKWSFAASAPIEAPAAAPLVGAAIGADDTGFFHAVLAYREDGVVRLGFSDGAACDRFSAVEPGPVLFEDAEAPSYVVSGGRAYVYFTRPPGEASARRTLWRIARDEAGGEPELLAELDADVASPVSVGLAGENDLVLAYPTLPGSGSAGIGLLVGAPDGRRWSKVEPSPVLRLPSTLDAFPGQRLAFDDDGVAAVALAWSQGEKFLLYAGKSRHGRTPSNPLDPLTSELGVGVARLSPASDPLTAAAVVPQSTCGDGVCDELEDDVSCETDCPAVGDELVADAFVNESAWRTVSNEARPTMIRYLAGEPRGLYWSSGEPTWSVFELERPVTGDFALSFDLFIAQADPTHAPCSFYVGLGSFADLFPETPDTAAESTAGVFARFEVEPECPSRYYVEPFEPVSGEGLSEAEGEPACVNEPAFGGASFRHFVLRRRGQELSVVTPRADGCGVVETALRGRARRDELPEILIGFGGGPFESCARGELPDRNTLAVFYPQANYGTLRNLKLHSLEVSP